MNFPDRFSITRRTEHSEDGASFWTWDPVSTKYPCRVSILDAFSSMSWAGNSSLSASTTNANLRVPKTLFDIPEPTYWLDDYAVIINSPNFGRMKESSDITWEITGKRVLSNHVLYLLKL